MSTVTRIAHDWAVRCFGGEHCNNKAVRGLRTLEEAIELAQALGVDKDAALRCVDMVYSRPAGDAQQEIGGVLLTTAILCESLYVDFEDMLERELRRVLQKSREHFASRNKVKDDLGLDGKAELGMDGKPFRRPPHEEFMRAGSGSYIPPKPLDKFPGEVLSPGEGDGAADNR